LIEILIIEAIDTFYCWLTGVIYFGSIA